MKRKDLYISFLFIVVIILFPAIFPKDYYISVAIFLGIYSIILFGLNILIGNLGIISLGHAAFFGLGAYSSAILIQKLAVHPLLGLPVAVISTCIFAFIIGYPTLRLKGYYIALATLAFGEMIQCIFSELKVLTGGSSGLGNIPHLELPGLVCDSEVKNYYFIWISVLILFFITRNLINSSIGRTLRAIRMDEEAANALGINVATYKLKAFIISSCYASIAGYFYAHYVTFISPDNFGMMTSFILVIVLIVGGNDFVFGGLIGSALIVILPELLHQVRDFSVIVYGFILLISLFYMPKGIFRGMITLIGDRGSKLRINKSEEYRKTE